MPIRTRTNVGTWGKCCETRDTIKIVPNAEHYRETQNNILELRCLAETHDCRLSQYIYYTRNSVRFTGTQVVIKELRTLPTTVNMKFEHCAVPFSVLTLPTLSPVSRAVHIARPSVDLDRSSAGRGIVIGRGTVCWRAAVIKRYGRPLSVVRLVPV